MHLQKGTVTVLHYDIREFNEAAFDEHLKTLPANFIQEINRMRVFKDKLRNLIGKLLLRKAISESGFTAELLLTLERNKNEKPFIKDWMPFNISHSEDMVVLVYGGDSELGIDIEKLDGEIDTDSTTNFFSNQEQEVILKNPGKETLIDTWVRKEAVLKAIGIGIANEPQQLDCSGDKVSYKQQHWHLKKLNIDSDYVCYLAGLNNNLELRVHQVPVL